MNNFGKVLIKMGLLSLFSVMPLMAQIGNNGVYFTASSPFYAGDVKLPAGNYKVVQPDADADILQIENRGDLRSGSSISNRQNLRFLTATLRSPSTNMGILTISIEFGLTGRSTA